VEHDGEVDVSIFMGKNILNGSADVSSTFQHVTGDNKIHCSPMTLPRGFEAGSAVVEVRGNFQDTDYSILSYKSIRALTVEPMILLQTDKSEYRPKQTVKLRVMAINYELKPAKVETIPEVWVTNPSNDRLAQWKDVELRKGVAQMEFGLSEEPQLGEWTIHVKHSEEKEVETKAKFVVAENVLPKFEVKIEAPKKILRDSTEESFKVCALYTHGGKVKGSLNATFYTKYKEGDYYRAKEIIKAITKEVLILEDGCGTVTLDNEELNEFAGRKRDFKLIATITEGITETALNATAKVDFVYTPYKITFGSSLSTHILGGFPYVGKISVKSHDGTPIGGVNLEICSRLFTSVEKMRNDVNKFSYKFYTYTEDEFVALGNKVSKILYKSVCVEQKVKEDGTLKFSVPIYNVPENVTKLSIKVNSLDAPAKKLIGILQPKAGLDIALTHSNSSAALAIYEEEDLLVMTCGNNVVPVYLSAKVLHFF
jgi:hypothetical protein